MLDDAEAGTSAAIVIRGELGIGKTTLLSAVSELAASRGMRTASVAGIEAEAPMGYAALHQLLRFFPGGVDRLPSPQGDALRYTLGLVPGPPPDRFLAGLGLLTLLADRAENGPLVTLVDDAQWIDLESGTALGFAARRLQAERVVMVFAVRDTDAGTPWLAGLPELRVGRLSGDDAARLLSTVTHARLGPDVERRLVEESGGNPLAIVEIARQLTPAQLAGADVLPDPLPAADSLRELFARRLGQLNWGGRLLLAVAAAEPTASAGQVWDVARRLGADPDDSLAVSGDMIRFTHPLERTVAYHSVPAPVRRRIHRELALGMDTPTNEDRVAWHLAMAATGPDDDVAGRLEHAAQRARDRGGYAATTALLEQSAALSVDQRLKTGRLLAAAEAALTAGRPGQARAMLDDAREGPADERQSALLLRLSGQALFAAGETDDAARGLLAAAKALMTPDPPLARRTLLEALVASQWGSADAFEEIRSFASAVDVPGDLTGLADLFLSGFLRRFAGDAVLAARLLRRALDDLAGDASTDAPFVALPPVVAATACGELIDDATAAATARVFAGFVRRTGALTALPASLIGMARVYVREGRFDDAEAALTEASQLASATGAPGTPDIAASQRVFLLCWRGAETEALAEAGKLTAQRARTGQGGDLVAAQLALLDLSQGRYQDAFERLVPITTEDRLVLGTLVLADFIEAAARSGHVKEANAALDRLAARATAGAALLGLGRLGRARAILASHDKAEQHYLVSIDALSRASSPTELARSHLVFGEWLRRQRRRRDARAELTAAHDMFARMGAGGFAERTRIELEATGSQVRKRSPETANELTPQEKQIAALVARGETNREVAAKLFISPATVEYHLRKIYAKLGVTSRTQLARKTALGDL